MKALSIRQPWAGLIACGRKTVETRTWETRYRGALLIVSGLVRAPEWSRLQFRVPGDLGGGGMAIAVAELYAIQTMSVEHEEAAMVNARPGLFAWYLRGVVRIEPFAVKGKLGLFDAPIPPEMRGDLSRMPTLCAHGKNRDLAARGACDKCAIKNGLGRMAQL